MVIIVPTKKTTPWYVAGLHFECVQCGACCAGPSQGYIWVTRPEIQLIADFLKMPVEQVRQNYLKRVGFRTTIIEQPNTKDCVFLRKSNDKKICVIYTVRPKQCRSWPFWPGNLKSPDTWNKVARKCAGINRGRFYCLEEIKRIKREEKWWQPARPMPDSCEK